MRKWMPLVLSVAVALPAAIYAVMQISDRARHKPEPVQNTIKIEKVVKIMWPGYHPTDLRRQDDALADQVRLACDNKRLCGYDHVFSDVYVGKIEVSWQCEPNMTRHEKKFDRHPSKMKVGGNPIKLVLGC